VKYTVKFGNIHSELISFLQNTFTALFNKGIELDSEFGHAVAQLVEAEVDTWEGIRHRWRVS
jgi:hypothetical protein